jgi:hypothetical protein
MKTDDRPKRTLEEAVRAIKIANAKQQPLFFKNKEEEFLWQHQQLLK